MSSHATGTFSIDSWDEEPYDEREGARLLRTRVTKTFQGEIDGNSTAELLMAHGEVKGSAAYVGVERFTGRVGGRAGSFVFLHHAVSAQGEGAGSWPVVPDSATGELRGLRGEGRITVEPGGGHTFVLDYDLGPAPATRTEG